MQGLDAQGFATPALTIALSARNSAAGVPLGQCVRCGDCATGCNFGAKESLDTNLLVRAKRAGASIYSGAAVERIERDPARGWIVHVNYTDDKLRRRQGGAIRLVAAKVVLAAGTFGSTEILLRSQNDALRFSRRLGHGFSGNGDSVATMFDLNTPANAVVDEESAPNGRGVGPTITGLVNVTAPALRDRFVIQDLAIPGSLRRLFEETAALANGFEDLARGDDRCHRSDNPDPCAIDEATTRRSLMVALIGHDDAGGRISLVGGADDVDGAVRVTWPDARDDPRLDVRQRRLERLLADSGAAGRQTRLLANPLWRLLPPKLEFLFRGARGATLTVHPLGGCPMGDDVMTGVVNDLGQVFDAAPPTGVNAKTEPSIHEGLVVLDGSVMPCSLGINPALTITALALRAVETLATQWYPGQVNDVLEQRGLDHRPYFRIIDPAQPLDTASPTKVEVVERLHGRVKMRGMPDPFHAELTLQFQPIALRQLMSPVASERTLHIDPARSRLRLFHKKAWDQTRAFADDEPSDEDAFLVAPIRAGTLQILHREASTALGRRLRALFAWFPNRGLRDTVQYFWDDKKGLGDDSTESRASIWQRMRGTYALTSLAGEVRRFDYSLEVGEPTRGKAALPHKLTVLRAIKRLTYSRRGNPWLQMMSASWGRGPLRAAPEDEHDLELDLRFLERRGVPLFRLVDQANEVDALIDTASFLLYLLRIMLRIHTWSFRKPDPRLPNAPKPNRFPSTPSGMAIRSVRYVALAKSPAGPPEPDPYIRLTRFAHKPDAHRTPVLMVHGYSTSGTTFAHHSVPSLARHFWELGWDPWVLDLRTSAAMDTARHGWTFEQVAYADIPVAIDHVVRETGFEKIHVVAHCMGAAMTCMALLGDLPSEPNAFGVGGLRHDRRYPDPRRYEPPDLYPELRAAMRTRIAALVLSQVAPITVFSPANVVRAFCLRYLRYYLSLDDYTFRVEGEPSLANQLFDRLLTTLPYPREEFDRANPFWKFWSRTPWTATRQRMDALYGRDFSLNNLGDEVLDHIDDLFGPLSIETVSQGIHVARRRVLTDKEGVNRYVTYDRLRKRLKIPLLSIHGEENGLIDVSTASYMQKVYDAIADDGVPRRAETFEGFGHQDMLVGRDAATKVFPVISGFLMASGAAMPRRPRLRVELPPLGVGISFVTDDHVLVHLNNRVQHAEVDAIAVIPVVVDTPGYYRLYRADGCSEPPRDADIGRNIQVVAPQRLALHPSKQPHAAPPEKRADWQSVKRRAQFVVDRQFWAGADGVLFVQIFGAAFEPAMRGDIADRIGELLRYARAERSVIPSSATELDCEAPASFCFALSSCQYTAGIIDNTPPADDHIPAAGPADRSYARLAQLLRSANPELRPKLLIMAGDHVYVDGTAGLFDPSVSDGRYFRPYEQLYSSTFVQDVARQIQVCAMLDDHEIADNWEREDERALEQRNQGVQAYLDYQRDGSLLANRAYPPNPNTLWSAFTYGGFDFFFADTRTDRDKRTAANATTAMLLGPRQMRALKKWLRLGKDSPKPRFVVSASILFPRRMSSREPGGGLQSDAWDGYPRSRDELLNFLGRHEIKNVIFLSGDEHLSLFASATLQSNPEVTVRSIHSSGMYAPFPFANSTADDFIANEVLTTDAARGIHWQIDTQFGTRKDGFALVCIRKDATTGRWSVSVRFDLDGGEVNVPPFTI
ncbi:MAG TPA: alpha/beta fold hydrolase [Polyangiales bacterium]